MAKKTSKHARKQPQLKRAPSKFQQAIPCRESILKAMSVLGKPAKLDELIHKLDAQPSQIEGLERRVKAMIRDGQLVKNRTGRLAVTKNMNLVKGKARMHRKGSLFLDLLEPHRADYPGIIPTFTSLQAREVMHDDVVLVRLVPLKQKGEYRVVLVDVISRGYDRLIGLCIQRHGLHYLETSQRLYTGTVLIDEASIKSDSCREGEYCLAKIKHYPSRYQDCIVQLEHHLGDHTKAGLERELVIHSFNLPAVFPDEVMSEAKVLAQTQIKADQYRDDWRSLPFVTIDGSDARDFDDAICVQSHDKGWTVRVAIADVSAFVTLGSAIDQEAQRRATSVYLPGSVIPMLPEVLCNDLCSLKPQVDRWVLGITIHMDKRLVVSDVTMHKAIIHSHARLIYEDAADMMTQVEQTQDPNKWQTMIHDAYRLYQSLLLKRRRRGALEIELPQPKVVFNEYRKIQGFIQESRTVAHKAIEELMLLANEQTALFMQRHGISGVYRNHVKPDAKRLEALLPLLETYGINVSKNKRLTPHLMQTIVDEVSALPNKTIIMPMVLSCMAQAEYQTHNLYFFKFSEN